LQKSGFRQGALAMKKLILLLVLLCAVPADAQFYSRVGSLGQTWSCSLAGLVAALTQCKALAAGVQYYITDIVVGTTTTTAGSWSIQSGTGSDCAAATTAVFPVNSTSARFLAPISTAASLVITTTTPIPVTRAHAVCIIGTATNTINIQISGFTN
jgi:hypothetical protein